MRQDSQKPAPEELLLAHTDERKIRIPDTRDEGLVKPAAHIELTMHVLPQTKDWSEADAWDHI